MSARPSTVYFYSTCVVDLLAPQAGVDAIHLLQEAVSYTHLTLPTTERV